MPLPKDMGKCMDKMKDEFPEGRSKKKMSKEDAKKQRIAACLSASGKSKTEGAKLTFIDFLLEGK